MWLEWLFRHKGKIIGAGCGLILGWIAIRFGLLRALFVGICLFVGLSIGSSMDKGRSWQEILSRFFDWWNRISSYRSSRWR